MSKKRVRFLETALCLVIAICLLVGFGTMRIMTHAETVTSTKWTAAYCQSKATDDTETGYTHFSDVNAWGERLYYNEKLTLDGLTVTIGSTNMVAGTRFGFGFPKTQDGYSPRNSEGVGDGVFNVTIVPSQYEGQNSLYINDTHADGTIVYLTGTTTPGVCTVDGSTQNRFVSATSDETRYSITFNYKGAHPDEYGNYWSVTITLEKGNTFRAGLTSATVDFLDSCLNGILDSNGQCYLSAWGLDNTGDFYIGIVTAEEKALLDSADSALTAYKTARATSSALLSARSVAVEAVKNVPELYQAEYQAKLATIDAIDSSWAVAYNMCAPATYDVATGFSTVNPSEGGDRLYHSQKVQLNGLQVTFGAYSQTSKARYGFGLISASLDCAKHSVIEVSTLNIYAFYEQYGTGRTDLFVYDSSDFANNVTETTVAYMDSSLSEKGVYKLDGNASNSLVTGQSSSGANAYVMTFNKVSSEVWSIKIDIITGNGWSGINSVTVYISSSVLANAIDNDGYCYISVWGMDNAAPFCMDVKEASLQTSISNVETAKQAYEEAIISGEGVTEAKSAYCSAVEALPANEAVKYAVEYEDLQIQEEELNNVSHSASVTVSDSLSLNYKISIPESLGVETITLTSEMRGEIVECAKSDATVDDEGRYVFTAQEVTPQNMTETISLNLTGKNADGETVLIRNIDYSVQQYCERLLETTADTRLRTALVDMLNYGTAAQNYVNRNTDNLANANISGYQPLATEFNANGAINVLAVNQGTDITFTAVTLSLEEKVAIYARFKTTTTKTLTATVQIGENEAKNAEIAKVKDGEYYVICDDVAPTQYADNIIFSVSVGGSVNAKCKYSINSYVQEKYNDTACGDLVKALYSYGLGVSNYVASINGQTPKNVLQDKFFINGLSMISPNGETTTTISTVNQGATPSWQVGQWDSKGDLATNAPTVSGGVYTYTDTAKTLSINTNTGSIGMEIKGSEEYADGDRSQVSTPWPHLLLQQDYYGDQLINFSQMSSVNMQMTYTVTECIDKMQGRVDAANLHCAQFVWYITLQNRTEGHAEFGEYMWFGMILYDNREEGEEFSLTYKVDDDSTANTGKMICQPASSDWSSTGKMAKVGETINVNFDILSIAQTAFNEAKKTYGLFSKSNWEDMYIGSMNFGIELPGTYDISVKIDNVGIMATSKS